MLDLKKAKSWDSSLSTSGETAAVREWWRTCFSSPHQLTPFHRSPLKWIWCFHCRLSVYSTMIKYEQINPSYKVWLSESEIEDELEHFNYIPTCSIRLLDVVEQDILHLRSLIHQDILKPIHCELVSASTLSCCIPILLDEASSQQQIDQRRSHLNRAYNIQHKLRYLKSFIIKIRSILHSPT